VSCKCSSCANNYHQVGKTYFTDPSYLAGLPYAELEEEIATIALTTLRILSFGHIVNMNNGRE
jgi:hypothetical protein